MKVSKSFLNDYIDIKDIDYKEIAEKMVFLGNEYDSISKISEATNLVIGYVKDAKKHPNADSLKVCLVDIGEQEPYQIVCGAPNVDKGQKVIVAKVGAVLPGDFIIKKSNIRGEESNGMICSLAEIGLESKFLTPDDIDGIHVLDDNAPVGNDAIKYIGFDDEVIDFDLTADRSDLLSLMGMAYEIGAIYDLEVKEPETNFLETGNSIKEDYKVTVDTPNCPFYAIRLVRNVKVGETPSFIKQRLMASGIRSINNVVDISNYVMLETGQPLHFFDADKMNKEIKVRMANDEEKLVTLDDKERILNEDDIVITDDREIIALGGVMGGDNTEVTNNTKNIIIESAIFNSKNIRNTAKRILRSEASSRFEKGVSYDRSILALNRACYLLNKYANGEVAPDYLKHDIIDKTKNTISISLNKINSILGMCLTKEDVEQVFEKLKFEFTEKNNEFLVIIPTRRMDLNIPEDLIEEVGRIIGYDNVVGQLPIVSIKRGSYTLKRKFVKQIKQRLFALGLNEVITYSLVGEDEINIFNNDDIELVKLREPQSIEHSIMRTSLIPSLLNVYKYNKARNIKEVTIFEIGSIYSVDNKNYVENLRLSGLLSDIYIQNKWQNKNVEVDFYVVKGLIESLLDYIGLENRYTFIEDKKLKDMHPGRSAKIKVGLDEVGFFGQVHPSVSKNPVYIFDIDLEILFKIKTRNIKFKELSKYPSVKKDVAFVIDKEINSSEIEKIIKKAGGRLLVDIDVFDVYEGDNIENNKKSIAYSLEFQDLNKTLTDEEITVIFNKIIDEVESKLGAILRDK